MTKNTLNQNAKYVQKFIESIEPTYLFSDKPINRFKTANMMLHNKEKNKAKKLIELKEKINSIENCNLKENSKNLILGDFKGDIGDLLNKMLLSINISREKIYLAYSINFRPPEDRKPTSREIKRYSIYLKEQILIINPKIIILMGSTAMESITGLNSKISDERGKWKEIILKGKIFPIMITFNPSYLIRFPENKKYSWVDLKKIRQKIQDLNIKF